MREPEGNPMGRDEEANSQTISDGEWELLDALWARRHATARQVAETVHSSRGWAYSTVKTMLDRMVDKGLVNARQVGNVWEYTPAVEPQEARRGAWTRFISSAFGGAVAPALAFIASEAKLSRKEREALLAMLREPSKPASKENTRD
jgi:BlaI family penicillinase repressor